MYENQTIKVFRHAVALDEVSSGMKNPRASLTIAATSIGSSFCPTCTTGPSRLVRTQHHGDRPALCLLERRPPREARSSRCGSVFLDSTDAERCRRRRRPRQSLWGEIKKWREIEKRTCGARGVARQGALTSASASAIASARHYETLRDDDERASERAKCVS